MIASILSKNTDTILYFAYCIKCIDFLKPYGKYTNLPLVLMGTFIRYFCLFLVSVLAKCTAFNLMPEIENWYKLTYCDIINHQVCSDKFNY